MTGARDKTGKHTNEKVGNKTNSKKALRRSQDKGISLRALEERKRDGRIVVEKREVRKKVADGEVVGCYSRRRSTFGPPLLATVRSPSTTGSFPDPR